MDALAKLSSVMGLSMTSGINLYATVAVVGLVTKFNMITGLPREFDAFDNDLLIIVAIALYLCEFAADKIPGFDSLWDSVHTLIRPFGAALISLTVIGEADPSVEALAGLFGASLALATHTAKAGTRLIVNTSPEPFSNMAVSVAEDIGVVGFSVLVLSHPSISFVLALLFLILLIWFGPGLWRGALLILKAIPVKLFSIFTGEGRAEVRQGLPDHIEEPFDEELSKNERIRVSLLCHVRKVKGCGRNRKGYLILTDRRMFFAFRKLFRTRFKHWNLDELDKAKLQKRFLVDILGIKSEGKFLQFIFLKNRSAAAKHVHEIVQETIGRGDEESVGSMVPST